MIAYLSYSAGVQSHLLLEMVLRGELARPEHFAVINADPGMEDERTYGFVVTSRERCKAAGIDFLMALPPSRGDLYAQLKTLRESGRPRMDHPPYFTKGVDAKGRQKRGRLAQKCTREFKIRPIRRALRSWLAEKFPTQKRPLPRVESWIGFAADEADRIKPRRKEDPQFITNRYPLIELGMDRAKVEGWYMKHGVSKPPRSVCAACFANGLAYYEDMYTNRPDDWDKAVLVDESIRDMTAIGVREPCFVSDTLIPLRELAERNFLAGTKEGKEHRCNSGVCFV